MRLKHWQGYGAVTATKVSKEKFTDYLGTPMVRMVIKVSGNHEWGLATDDKYHAFWWLLKRFDRETYDDSQIHNMRLVDTFEDGIEVCTYTFVYEESKEWKRKHNIK